MYIPRLIALCFFFYAASVFSAEIHCDISSEYADWGGVHVPFELKPSNLTMTVGESIADWQVLYTAYVNIGMQTSKCDSGTNALYYSLISSSPSVGKQGSYDIYSTDVQGIGISITHDGGTSSVPVYPKVESFGTPSLGTPFWAKIIYWKIPGKIPMTSGPITVTGPDAAVLVMSSGNNYATSDPNRVTDDGLAYISSSRILKLTMMFQPGTCNIEGDNVKVDMGAYDGANGYSSWKDASFKILCPNALGYGGMSDTDNRNSQNDKSNFPTSIPTDATITKSTKLNGRITISIVPYTEVTDYNNGILSLDGTGAKGYGIQLAWGDYSTQNATEPAKPVILNSYIDANSLNSAFRSGDTPIEQNAFTGGDNTIKMAARYIRTSGDTAPGPANAVVQVIANYQ